MSLDFAGDESLLSADELRRADGLRVPQERRRFVAGRVLARQVLAQQLGILPREVVFVYGAHGKPSLSPPSRRQGGLFFNTSRSEDDWVCAISRAGEVGVDVETVRDLPELDAMIRAYCTEREQLALRVLATARSALSCEFLRCWTRKEAMLKASGAGLSIPPNQIDVLGDANENELVTQILPSASGGGQVVVSVAVSVKS